MSGNNFSFSNDLGSSLFGQSPLDALLSDESGLQALMDALNKTNAGPKGASLDSQIPSAYTAPFSPLQAAQKDFNGSSGGGSTAKSKQALGDRDPLTGLSNNDALTTFSVKTESSLTMNGGADLDGDPLVS
jgi:hypothetical protein